jgi:hypothetical protein
MLGGTGNVTLNASDVMTGGCDGVRRAAFEFEGSDFEDRVVTLVRNKFFGVEEQVDHYGARLQEGETLKSGNCFDVGRMAWS